MAMTEPCRAATSGQQLFDIAVAEREAVVQPDGMTDDLGGKAVAAV